MWEMTNHTGALNGKTKSGQCQAPRPTERKCNTNSDPVTKSKERMKIISQEAKTTSSLNSQLIFSELKRSPPSLTHLNNGNKKF
jgi:hypothetical protein